MTYFCKQLLNDDCAFACLKIALANYTHNKKYLWIINAKTSGTYSYLDIVKEGRKLGFILEGYRIDNKSMLKKNLPLICEINQGEVRHSVVLIKVYKNIVIFLDPSFGKIKTSKSDFFKIFTGNVLLIQKKEKDISIKKNKTLTIFKIGFNLITLFINAISIGILYYLNQANESFYVGCLFLIVLTIILNRLCNLMFEKVFNKLLVERNIPVIKSLNSLSYIFDFKRTFLTQCSGLLNNISIVLILLVLLSFNNLYLLPLLLFISMVECIKAKSITPSIVRNISIYEISLVHDKTKLEPYKRLNILSSKIKIMITTLDIIKLTTIIFGVIMCSYVVENFTLNFAIFYFFSLYIYGDRFSKIVDFYNNRYEFLRKEQLFLLAIK